MDQILVVATLVIMAKHDTAGTDPRSMLLVALNCRCVGCEEHGSGISNNEKNQRSAASLYIAPGFALMHS